MIGIYRCASKRIIFDSCAFLGYFRYMSQELSRSVSQDSSIGSEEL